MTLPQSHMQLYARTLLSGKRKIAQMIETAFTYGYNPNQRITKHQNVHMTILSFCLLDGLYERFMYLWEHPKIDRLSRDNKRSLIHGLVSGAENVPCDIQLKMAVSFFFNTKSII